MWLGGCILFSRFRILLPSSSTTPTDRRFIVASLHQRASENLSETNGRWTHGPEACEPQ